MSASPWIGFWIAACRGAGPVLALLLICRAAQAWGPHPTITQAALDALGTNDALVRYLGAYAQRLTNYAWMADYRRLVFEEPGQLYYADDYLLFPEVTRHLDHICPEVNKTFRPYFKRAVQALRTESPANAARWIGSLLHFVQDAGSPPHAAEIRGDVHTKMENWVDAKRIALPGYRPRLLGATEEEAAAGLVRRMDELIAFSKERGRRLRVPVEIGNQSAVRPVVLESALETSRMTADVLHTLGQILSGPATHSTALQGVVSCPPPVGLERFPAKVVLAGTSFSTLADLSGHYQFRQLPVGTYEVAALRPGGALSQTTVKLVAGETNVSHFTLTGATTNWVRNGDFRLSWLRAGSPDCWYYNVNGWEGEVIPLQEGQRYRLRATFKADATNDVLVRWTQYYPHAVPRNAPIPRFESRVLTRSTNEFVFTGAKTLGLLQIILRTSKPPGSVWESVSLVPVGEE